MKGLWAILLSIAFLGCSTYGYKTRSGTSQFPPTDYQSVQVLFDAPDPATYQQIGFCSVMGGAFAPDTDMLRKLQKSGADLGADAVILRTEGNAAYGGGSTAGFAFASYPKNSGIAIKWNDPSRRLPPRS